MLQRLKAKIQARKNSSNITFWFLRHPKSEGNERGDDCPIMHDTPLTDAGREETRRAIAYFKKNNITLTDIYSSPMQRAKDAADMFGEACGVPVKVKDGLRERNWGEWKDLCWSDASARLKDMSLDERFAFIPEGGESWKQMEDRLFAVLEEIAEENTAGENILIIMHRGGLRAVMPILAKAGKEKHEEFSMPTGSISKFSFDAERFDFVGLVPEAVE